MASRKPEPDTYEVAVSVDPRLYSVHLGEQKYTTPARAIAELVANSLDAEAALVQVSVHWEETLGVDGSILIEDDGRGITPEVIKTRIAIVGCGPIADASESRMGRFGIGRLAVHRLGAISRWTTVAAVKDGKKIRSDFTLSVDQPSVIRVTETPVPKSTKTGTTIRIEELRENISPGLMPSRLSDELLSQFCGYMLANPLRRIEVQGQTLDVTRLVDEQAVEIAEGLDSQISPLTIRHVLLKQSVERNRRFPHQVLLTAKGRTVKFLDTEKPLLPHYVGLADSPYLDRVVTTNRESLIEFDPHVQSITEEVLKRAISFNDGLAAERQVRFIEEARQKDFYPFRNSPEDSLLEAEQVVYDVVLEKIHEHANLERMSQRQQAVVYGLLRRAIDNEDFFEVLAEVANLSDEDVEKFRALLKRTTLESVIRLASEVNNRLTFLDFLNELVYGDAAKHVKERSQLHKILEPRGWLFGARFNLATSDKAFRKVIRRHRELAGLDPVPEDVLKGVQGGSDIPDLFLACVKDYPADPKHHHLLVELKAPRVKVGTKEFLQGRTYLETLLKSPEVDKQSALWDIYVVSAEVSSEVQSDRTQDNKKFGLVRENQGVRLWIFQWSEVISAAREEMHLVREHLERRTRELSVPEYMKEEFPELAGILDLRSGSRAAETRKKKAI